MILYNSHDYWSFLRWRGSAFPKALRYALLPSLISLALRLLDNHKVIDLHKIDLSSDQNVYQGFTYVVGFLLVFRASQSYGRYWASARAAHQMGAEWYDAAASLIAFANTSGKSEKQIQHFAHTAIRLFCILHAMALEEIAGIVDENFPLLDLEGMEREDLRILTFPESQGRKVEIVNQWIKTHILNSMNSGVLTVPPPIITRVFQQMGGGLVHYHEVLQVVIWPFPFPYAQMSFILLIVHAILTPVILAQTSAHPASAWFLTFTSVLCMRGVDLIAAELENPFGWDSNDLPTYEMHHEMMQDLISLVHPCTWTVPRLLPDATMEYDILADDTMNRHIELMKRQERGVTSATTIHWSKSDLSHFMSHNKRAKMSHSVAKMNRMKSWMAQTWPNSGHKVESAFNMEPLPADCSASLSLRSKYSLASRSKYSLDSVKENDSRADVAATVQSNGTDTKGGISDLESSKEPVWHGFLLELSKNMQQIFSQQSEQLKSMQQILSKHSDQLTKVCELQLKVFQEVKQGQHTPPPTSRMLLEMPGDPALEMSRGPILQSVPARKPRFSNIQFCTEDAI